MPRFYFHFRRNGRLIVDPNGGDLADLEVAWGLAVLSLRHYAALTGKRWEAPCDAIEAALIPCLEITDEGGRVLATVRFGDAAGRH